MEYVAGNEWKEGAMRSQGLRSGWFPNARFLRGQLEMGANTHAPLDMGWGVCGCGNILERGPTRAKELRALLGNT
jgi:hypothetical protein